MTIAEIIQSAHRKWSGDIDYPTSGSDDMEMYVDFYNDAVTEWERQISAGVAWQELMTSETITCGGTGTDDLPGDFLSFIATSEDSENYPAILKSGNNTWVQVHAREGLLHYQENNNAYVFWRENGKLRTLPAISGDVIVPYLRKATRAVTGEETTTPECPVPTFLVNFTSALISLHNEDQTKYEQYALTAQEILTDMMGESLSEPAIY